GIGPALYAFRVNLSTMLHEEGRTGTGGPRTQLVRRGLVVAQVALAFVLLVGAGLLLASFRRLLAVDPGFRADGVLSTATVVSRTRYPTPPDLRNFMNRTLVAIRSIPGVTDAGAASGLPLDGTSNDNVVLAEGYQLKPGESVISPRMLIVTPGYFEALGIKL